MPVAKRVPPVPVRIYGKKADWLGRGPWWSKTPKGVKLKYHAGVDLVAKGKPVVAPEAGRVVYAIKEVPEGKSMFGGYGPQVVCIAGESGVWHWLAHLTGVQVRRNQYVEADEVVAAGHDPGIGHVHWEIRLVLNPYATPEYWPWAHTCDPIRWLHGEVWKAKDAIATLESGVPIREAYPVKVGDKGEIEFEPMVIRADGPKKGNGSGWIVIGIAVVAVLALALVGKKR